jgi:hypothetical protein
MVEMTGRKTIIWVSKGVWKWLQSQKEIGESFDRLLIRLLDLEIDSEEIVNSPCVKEEN